MPADPFPSGGSPSPLGGSFRYGDVGLRTDMYLPPAPAGGFYAGYGGVNRTMPAQRAESAAGRAIRLGLAAGGSAGGPIGTIVGNLPNLYHSIMELRRGIAARRLRESGGSAGAAPPDLAEAGSGRFGDAGGAEGSDYGGRFGDPVSGSGGSNGIRNYMELAGMTPGNSHFDYGSGRYVMNGPGGGMSAAAVADYAAAQAGGPNRMLVNDAEREFASGVENRFIPNQQANLAHQLAQRGEAPYASRDAADAAYRNAMAAYLAARHG